jgi:hypothetical protein
MVGFFFYKSMQDDAKMNYSDIDLPPLLKKVISY